MKLIDSDALEHELITKRRYLDKDQVLDVAYIINKAPAIDAVSVVRCKDCKHGEVDDPEYFPELYYCHAGCGWNKGNFFCYYGVRKEGIDADNHD